MKDRASYNPETYDVDELEMDNINITELLNNPVTFYDDRNADNENVSDEIDSDEIDSEGIISDKNDAESEGNAIKKADSKSIKRLRDKKKIAEYLKSVTELERNGWESSDWCEFDIYVEGCDKTDIKSVKRELILNYIGADCDDAAYRKLVKYVDNNETFLKLVNINFTSDLVISWKDIIVESFVQQSNRVCEILDEMLDEHAEEVCAGFKELDTYPKEKEFIRFFRRNSYNEKEESADSISGDKITDEDYRLFAGFIMGDAFKPAKYNYDYTKMCEAKKELDKEIDKLASDRDFRGFTKWLLAQGDKWLKANRKQLLYGINEDLDEYREQLAVMRKFPNKRRLFGEPDYSIPVDKADIRKKADKFIKMVESNDNKEVFDQFDSNDACDYIIAQVFKGPNFEETILSDHNTTNGRKKVTTMDVLSAHVTNMRSRIMEDKVFLDLLTERHDRKNFYSIYKAEVKKQINKSIGEEPSKSTEYIKTEQDRQFHNAYRRKHIIKLYGDTEIFLDSMTQSIKKINEGKKPSKLMKELIKALDKVNTLDGKITFADMEKLNKAALNYYKDRQGWILSPVTDKGKARLFHVEELAKVTTKIMDEQRNIEKELLAGKAGKDIKAIAAKNASDLPLKNNQDKMPKKVASVKK